MNTHNQTNTFNKNKQVVLAFSGGLDTSFCVPYLIDQGYQVTSIFVDSGGVSEQEKKSISKRAYQLGVSSHIEVNIAEQLWNCVITPLIQGGHWYQNQYPLLCSDRYLIVEACLKYCDKIGTKNFAHGCTGMGNDQIRFDLAANCLGNYNIISPIREIQKEKASVREQEKKYLISKGFDVSDKVTNYSINENLLGTTISGSEIDQWQQPTLESYVLTQSPKEAKHGSTLLTLAFKKGKLSAVNNKLLSLSYTGREVMQQLNQLVGEYSVGRGIYTGDTTIGIKGRIVFEAPALHALNVAHRALEQAVLSKAQNRFKTSVAEKWTELVYEGLFFEPLKYDLEAFLESSQTQVTGKVTLEVSQGQILAVAVDSPNILTDKHATYAQSASWNIEETLGFINLFGKSTCMAADGSLRPKTVSNFDFVSINKVECAI
jgi:argininosuccinate synthase